MSRPGIRSRYFGVPILKDEEGREHLEIRAPLRLPFRSTDRVVVVNAGETLHHVAARTLADAQLYWIIADANDIFDPTIVLDPGLKLRVPANVEDLLA